MPRRRAHFEHYGTDCDTVSRRKRPVDTACSAAARDADLAPERLLHQPGPCDVIGVNVGLKRVAKLQPELPDQGEIA